jgi:uncharacterized RDD family membrane protein YckC
MKVLGAIWRVLRALLLDPLLLILLLVLVMPVVAVVSVVTDAIKGEEL